jgi:hypothetical protein
MGRQTGFHMLPEDCKQFLDFVHKRDPVVVTDWRSTSPEIMERQNPWEASGWYCLWNQTLLPKLEREFVPKSDRGPYYRTDSALSVIEFSYPGVSPETWNGRSVLTQGRVWAGFERENRNFEKWYSAIVRWIRKSFVKNPVPLLGGYIGPAAYESYKQGLVLLPMFRPPLTTEWLSWLEAQDQHRAVFSK